MIHVLLKPGLENFEDYFASVWDELFPEYYSKFSVGINAALEKKKKTDILPCFHLCACQQKFSEQSEKKRENFIQAKLRSIC